MDFAKFPPISRKWAYQKTSSIPPEIVLNYILYWYNANQRNITLCINSGKFIGGTQIIWIFWLFLNNGSILEQTIEYRSVTSSFILLHYFACFWHISVERDENLRAPNLTWIGSWWPEIWPHEYRNSPIEISEIIEIDITLCINYGKIIGGTQIIWIFWLFLNNGSILEQTIEYRSVTSSFILLHYFAFFCIFR